MKFPIFIEKKINLRNKFSILQEKITKLILRNKFPILQEKITKLITKIKLRNEISNFY